MKTFLTAEWKNLINITYAVDPAILQPYLPKGLTLDLIDGKAFVSLVAFEFNNVKVKGMRIPFHRDFPEINLRFYASLNSQRGVVFIKEFVPKYFVALVANKIYNESYHAIRMNVKTTESNTELNTEHLFKVNRNDFSISVTAEKNAFFPSEKSTEHFFKEHNVGFGRDKKGNTLSYEVQHPVWAIYPVKGVVLNVDFEKKYGKEWKFLNDEKPYNVMLAKGSEVKVGKKENC